MKKKFAVALAKGENEMILGIFDTKAEADTYGKSNLVPHSAGLEYCFTATFVGGKPRGRIKVYDYYNVSYA